jgi:hypothetical protein
MGWAKSPVYFCTAMETGRRQLHHRFEKFMIPDLLPKRHGHGTSEIHVFVDNYALAVV